MASKKKLQHSSQGNKTCTMDGGIRRRCRGICGFGKEPVDSGLRWCTKPSDEAACSKWDFGENENYCRQLKQKKLEESYIKNSNKKYTPSFKSLSLLTAG